MVGRKTFVVDSETTSLAADHAGGTGQIWELCVCDRSDSAEYLWRMPADLAKADPESLRKNLYYERTRLMKKRDERVYNLATVNLERGGNWSNPAGVAAIIAPLLADATVFAANPAFDASFMADFLRFHGHAPTWHYRLRDLGSMAYGYLTGYPEAATPVIAYGLGSAPPLIPPLDASTDDFAKALGVSPEQFTRHSALGDVRLLCACLDVIEGRRGDG